MIMMIVRSDDDHSSGYNNSLFTIYIDSDGPTMIVMLKSTLL